MKLLNKCAAALAAVLLTVVLALPCPAREDRKVLRVAFPLAEGFTMMSPEGRRYGLVVDFLNEIAKYTGWEYEYVDVDGDTMIDEFFNDQFDLMGGTYYADGFEEYFAYPEYNCGYSSLVLLARRDDDSIKSYDYRSLNGKTIGVYENNRENIRRLQEYLTLNALDCNLRSYDYEQLKVTGSLNRFLAAGEIDLLLSNSGDLGEEFFSAFSFESQPHYIITNPGNQEVLDGLNMALKQIYDADPNFAKKRYAENFSTVVNGFVRLNDREQDYISKKGTVTVAVPRDWHPLYCVYNGDGHNGLIPDVLDAVTEFSGLEFSYILCEHYADALNRVQQGEADLLGFFVGSNEDALQRGLALSGPYVELDSILVRNKKSSYPSENLTGAVLDGRVMPGHLNAAHTRVYSDAADALSDVNRGKVDFFYGISSHLERLIQQENFTNVVQVNLVNDSLDIGFAMQAPVQPELLTILNKTINHLTDEQMSAISSRNIVSLGESHMSLASIVYANPGLAISVVGIILTLILLAVILVFRSRLHAAAMRVELARAEADSRAKSAFLSRMSHEIRTPMNAIVGLTDLTDTVPGLPENARENLSKIRSSSRYLLNLISDILDMSRIENGKMEISREPFSIQAMLDEIEHMMKNVSAGREVTLETRRDVRDDIVVGDPLRLRQVLINLLSNAFKFTPDGGSIHAQVTQEAANDQEVALTFRVTDTGVGIAPENRQRIFNSFEQVGPNITKSQGTGLGLAISSHIVHLMGGQLQLESELGVGSAFYFSVTLPRGRERRERPPERREPERNIFRDVNILMAEDNDLNAEIAMELLSLQGAAVVRAKTGKDALDAFEASEPGGFHIILMDILMPEMNGLEATRAIRALSRPDAATVPIIAMTANAFKEDEAAARAAGMTGFLPKPIDVERLYQELRDALGNDAR